MSLRTLMFVCFIMKWDFNSAYPQVPGYPPPGTVFVPLPPPPPPAGCRCHAEVAALQDPNARVCGLVVNLGEGVDIDCRRDAMYSCFGKRAGELATLSELCPGGQFCQHAYAKTPGTVKKFTAACPGSTQYKTAPITADKIDATRKIEEYEGK